MVGNKPSRSANAILYVVSPSKLFEWRIAKKAKTTTTATHASRIRSEPWENLLMPLVNQANVPPFAAAPVELPRVLRSHAGKALRRRMSPLAVENSKGTCAGSRRQD